MSRVGWIGVMMLVLAGPIWAAQPESAGQGGPAVLWQAGEPQQGGGLGVIFVNSADPETSPPSHVPFHVQQTPGGGIVVGLPEEGSQPMLKPSEYWLGVECTPVDPTLQAQLQLPEGQGLVVRSVMPKSPAAKAGLKEHDILLQAGGKPLTQIQDLVAAVDEAKEKKLSLEIIREGKRQKIEVVPAKRPSEQVGPGFWFGTPPIPAPGNPDFEAFRKWLEKVQPGQPLRFRFFQPGFVIPPGTPWQGALPQGLSIAITKTGDEPARISVKKDGQSWEVTEKELDKLPPEVRTYVERLLGKTDRDSDFEWKIPPGFEQGPQEHRLPGRPRGDLQKQLDKQQQQIEKLQKQLEEIKESLEKSMPTVPLKPRKRSEVSPPKEKV